MKIEIKIHTGNAAFETDRDGEVKRIIRDAVNKVSLDSNKYPLRDYNGNVVGYINIQSEED